MDASVIVPTRNRSALLTTTLRSVLRQQDVAFEVIVVDEASTDGTPAMVAMVGDTRIRVIRHDTPHGLPAARNHGAANARGDWLAFLDDDDLWAPDKLVRQLHAARDAARDWAYTGSVNLDGSRIVYGRPPLPPEEVVAALLRYNPIPGGGSNVVVRRTAWLRAGPFETGFRNGGEDWEMSIRLAKQGPPAWVCSPLIAKRVHQTNMSLDPREIVSATKLIEGLHNISADWGRVHRWLAERYLRSGKRGAALAHFAIAAVLGQPRGVFSDLRTMLRRRLGRLTRHPGHQSAQSGDAWAAAAAEWLRDYEEGVQ